MKNKNISYDPFSINWGCEPLFIILFSYWFSITTIKNAIATQQKNTELQIRSYFY